VGMKQMRMKIRVERRSADGTLISRDESTAILRLVSPLLFFSSSIYPLSQTETQKPTDNSPPTKSQPQNPMPYLIPPSLLIQPDIPCRITRQRCVLFHRRTEEFSVLLRGEGTVEECVDLGEDCCVDIRNVVMMWADSRCRWGRHKEVG
jgi:hypothetical protein